MILYGFEYKGEFIYSIDRHDFTMTDDGVAGIDGGQFNEYSRIIGSVACDKLMYVAVPYTYAELKNAYESGKKISIFIKDCKKLKYPLSAKNKKIRSDDKFVWGSYGLDGNQPLKYKMLWELETSHLEAILRTQLRLSKDYIDKINQILEERKKDPSLDPKI